MPLPLLSAEDATTLANLPDRVRQIISRDLETKENARLQRERDQQIAAAAEASRLAHPVHQAILQQNAVVPPPPPARPPRPAGVGPPAPAGMSARDAQSYARSPAYQSALAHNDRVASEAAAKRATLAVARVEQLEAQAAAVQAAAQAEEMRAAAVARTHQIERALIALAERFIKQHTYI
jgi:hypothetical protein